MSCWSIVSNIDKNVSCHDPLFLNLLKSLFSYISNKLKCFSTVCLSINIVRIFRFTVKSANTNFILFSILHIFLFLNTLKTLWHLFIDWVQLSQEYRATMSRELTFYHSLPRGSWHSMNRPWTDKGLRWAWSHSVVLSTFITRPLL